MTLVTNINAGIVTAFSKSADLGGPAGAPSLSRVIQLPNGVGDGQADKVWGDIRSINAASNDDLDLAGVLEDIFGDIFTAAEVVALEIYADPANAGNLIIGNHPTAAWVGPFGAATHTLAVKAGGHRQFYDPQGWPVTPTTADMLRINNPSGSTATYSILIVARSA